MENHYLDHRSNIASVVVTQEMHKYYERRYTPKVKYTKACGACSLKDICLPRLGKFVSAKTYIGQMLEEKEEGAECRNC